MNKIARELSKDYRGPETYLVVRNYSERGSLLYKVKSDWELEYVPSALEVAVADNIQVITTNATEAYAEYAPYIEFKELRYFMAAALALE